MKKPRRFTFKDVGDCIVVYGTGCNNPPKDKKNDCKYGVLHYDGDSFIPDPFMDYYTYDDLQQILEQMGKMRR